MISPFHLHLHPLACLRPKIIGSRVHLTFHCASRMNDFLWILDRRANEPKKTWNLTLKILNVDPFPARTTHTLILIQIH